MGIKAIKVGEADSGWDSFVQAHPNATAYHLFGWGSVIEKSFGHECHYLAAIDDSGMYQAILPMVHMRSMVFGNFLVSLPFVNYGGILELNEKASALLLRKAEELRCVRRATHAELRNLGRSSGSLPTRQHKVTMLLQLPQDANSLWRAFKPKVRNQVRKAEKSGLTPAIGHIERLDEFYQVFARNMRDLGTPVYGKKFFQNILETFPNTTAIFTVYYEGEVIAAALASWFKDTFEVPWASSVSDYKTLCPNNLLYWEMIQHAIGRGFGKFDFGRSSPHGGTYMFKKQWGATPVQLHWEYLLAPGKKCPT